MKAQRFLFTVASVTLVPMALMAASATDVLQKAQEADRHVSYRGMKTAVIYTSRSPITSTLKVVHLKPDLTRTEYFTPAALAGIIMIQDGDDIWKFNPRQDVWEHFCAGARISPETIKNNALKNYNLRIVGTDHVAGRPAYVVHATPRRSGDNIRMWVDKQHFLIVGTQVESSAGKIVNSSRFTSIDFNPGDILPSAFKVTGKVKSSSTKPCGKFDIVRPKYVPKGYRLLGAAWMSVKGHSCAHLQYSNGANTISLFERQCSEQKPGLTAGGKFTNILSWARDGISYTLIGNISRSELQKMADSIK